MKNIVQVNKKPRTFDTIVFDLQTYDKKPKMQETLKPVDRPFSLCILDNIRSFKNVDMPCFTLFKITSNTRLGGF